MSAIPNFFQADVGPNQPNEESNSLLFDTPVQPNRWSQVKVCWRPLMGLVGGTLLVITGLAVAAMQVGTMGVALGEAEVHAKSKLAMLKQQLPAHLNVLQLLQMGELREVIEESSLRLVNVAQQYQTSMHDGTRRLDHTDINQHIQRLDLPLSEQTRLRKEARMSLDACLYKFFVTHPKAADELRNVNITGEQGATALSMLYSFTDERIFDLGLKIGKAIHRTSQGRDPLTSTISQIHDELSKHFLKVRHLREDLIPASLQNLKNDLKQQHVKILDKKGAFSLKGQVGGWGADLEVYDSRRLHTEEQAAITPAFSTSVLALPPWTPTPLPKMYGGVSVQQSTPVNWFTIGAPVVSSMVGLTLLSLMAFLPGTDGNPVNRAANYGLWGVQGSAMLGSCLANIGYKKVFYFAPCIIDFMFFGIEVAWVFFDGGVGRVPRPSFNVQCDAYALWARFSGTVCGNCMARVPTQPNAGRCDVYCESFGHECVFAATEVRGTCAPLSSRRCNEQITGTNTMLCQCRQVASSQVGNRLTCSSYSLWPRASLEYTCGECRAMVDTGNSVTQGRNCDDFCESFGHRCVAAAEPDGRTCQVANTVSCSAVVTDLRLLCTCETDPAARRPFNNCEPYSSWPGIAVTTCGACQAVVPTLLPNGTEVRSCTEYCNSFGHGCGQGFRNDVCTDITADFDTIGCRVDRGGPTMRCICIR